MGCCQQGSSCRHGLARKGVQGARSPQSGAQRTKKLSGPRTAQLSEEALDSERPRQVRPLREPQLRSVEVLGRSIPRAKPPNGSGAQRPPAAVAEALPSTDARQDTSWTKALAVRCSALLGGARGTPAIALEPKFRAAPPSARQPEAAGEQDELHQGRVAASRREVLGPGALELARQRNMIRPAGPKRPSRLTDRALSGRRPPRPRGYRAPTPDKISPGRKRWRSAAAPC